jgi:hypothetical protein
MSRVRYENPIQAQGFAQMWHVIGDDSALSDGAYRLLAKYMKYAQGKGSCYPGLAKMAKEMGRTTRTIMRWNNELSDLGYIKRVQRKDDTAVTVVLDITQNVRLQQAAEEEMSQTSVTSVSPKEEQVPSNTISSSPSEKKPVTTERVAIAKQAGDSVPAKPGERKRPRVVVHPKRKVGPHTRMVRILAAAFRFPDKLSQRQRGRLNRLATRILDDYTEEEVRDAGEEWWRTWPGNQGPGNVPKDDQFMERLEGRRVAKKKRGRVVRA